MTQWAFSWLHNVSLVRALGTRLHAGVVHGCADEMEAWIVAVLVNVVILGDATHCDGV